MNGIVVSGNNATLSASEEGWLSRSLRDAICEALCLFACNKSVGRLLQKTGCLGNVQFQHGTPVQVGAMTRVDQEKGFRIV